MAKFEILIPFILHCEAGLAKRHTILTYEDMFAVARATGYANDPADSGGPTMCGVTLATYEAWRLAQGHYCTTVEDLRNISYEEWRDILRSTFWNRWRADEIDCQSVANALVDWTWVSGSYGITYPQQLLRVKPDGKVGPITIAAVNSYADQHELFDRIQQSRRHYHQLIVQRNPKKKRFINGWQNRVSKIKYGGFNYE